MSAVRVHTHPRPIDHDYDFHLPYFGNSYDQPGHGTHTYLQEFLKRIPTDQTVCLVSNGEPISRSVAVKHIIEKNYSNIEIESVQPLYDQQDVIFQNGYAIIDKSPELDAEQVIALYLTLYEKLPKFSQRYSYEFHDRDHGYFDAVKRHWYQFGRQMPAAPDQNHQQLYEKLQKLFDQLVNTLEPLAASIGVDRDRLESNLMIRLNHNPPGSLFENQLLVNRHGDNSIFTAWVFENQPGGHIDFGQELEHNPCAIETAFDSQQQIMLFPGFDYCDQARCMTPATFHSVKKTTNQHRVSVVAFLKK